MWANFLTHLRSWGNDALAERKQTRNVEQRYPKQDDDLTLQPQRHARTSVQRARFRQRKPEMERTATSGTAFSPYTTLMKCH
jgi:hypothetical protein